MGASKLRSVVLALAGLAVSGMVHPTAAQDRAAVCEAGVIATIQVDNRSIYDVGEGNPLGWMYKLANALHITTRPSFIRREALFEVGDCFDPALLEDTGRILRSYPFIGTADVSSTPRSDGDHDVLITTQDEWTTKVDLGVSFDQGLQLERLDITEENVLGQGVLAAVYFRRRKEQRDVGLEFQQPRLFGTRVDATFGIGRTRVGNFVQQSLTYPFVGEVGRLAVSQSYRRRDELFRYSAPGDSITHALLPFNSQFGEVAVARRIGDPGNLTLFGVGVSTERVRFGGFPGDVEIALDNDFGTTFAAPDDVRDAVSAQVGPRVTTRLNLMLGQRNLRFARPRGLDLLTGDQDVRMGTDFGLTLGKSLGVLGVDGLPAPEDVFARARLFAGHDPGASFVFLDASLDGRRLSAGTDRWRDVVAEVDLYSYLRTEELSTHTLFVRASGSGGWSMERPFQLTLGGRESVRGLVEEDAPGARRLLFTLEDRVRLGWPKTELMDLGLTLFGDAGRVWAGDVPYGTDSGWVGTIGGGLRLGLPAGGRGLIRIDLAFPVGADPEAGPVFRVTAIELLGFISGFADPQVERSRLTRVGPDFFVTENR